MTPQEDIDAIKRRLLKAEADRDAWRASGPQEKYLEAYSMVEALELQLDQRQQTVRTPAGEGMPPAGRGPSTR